MFIAAISLSHSQGVTPKPCLISDVYTPSDVCEVFFILALFLFLGFVDGVA